MSFSNNDLGIITKQSDKKCCEMLRKLRVAAKADTLLVIYELMAEPLSGEAEPFTEDIFIIDQPERSLPETSIRVVKIATRGSFLADSQVTCCLEEKRERNSLSYPTPPTPFSP
jgi:hypothetical protein